MVARLFSMPALAAASFSLVLGVSSAGCMDGTTPNCSDAADMCGPVNIDSGPLPDAATPDMDAGDMDAAPAVDAPPGVDGAGTAG